MEFRRAESEDVALIRELADEIFRFTYESLISPEQMTYMFEWMYAKESLLAQMQGGCVFFIAYENDAPCGFFSVELKDSAKAYYHLQKLYLLPSHHGKGAGERLIRGVFAYINELSPDRAILKLNVNRENKRAIRFYEKIGLIKLRAVDVRISDDFYMNDYIMGIEFERLGEGLSH